MSEEIHAKLLAFLSPSFARQDHRQAVRLDLLHSQPNARDVELRHWERKAAPEMFEQLELVEGLIREIINICEGHADSFGYGTHRFVVRVIEHMGGKSVESFRIKPSYDANDQALVPNGMAGTSGNEAALGVLTQHSGTLLRVNQQMFESSFRTLALITENMREENIGLRTENADLRRRLEAAESTKDEREYQYAMAAQKNERVNKVTDTIQKIGTVVAAKITGAGKELGVPDALTMLLIDFGKSLRPQQLNSLMQVLDQGQLIQFMAIMEMVGPKQAANGQPSISPP